MARNRVIYQSEAVYVSQDVSYSGAPGITNGQCATNAVKDLNRIQSANYSFNVTRQDVNQFGDRAAIDRVITESPTVSLDGSYYLANFSNEHRLGLSITQSGTATYNSAITNIIDSSSNAQQKSYYILTAKQGKDANQKNTIGIDSSKSGNYESIIGIGNGFLNSYSSEGAVGGMPTVSFSVEGQNMNFTSIPWTGNTGSLGGGGSSSRGFRLSAGGKLTHISGYNAAVSPTDGTTFNSNCALPVPTGNAAETNTAKISSLRPGDITLSLAPTAANLAAAANSSAGMTSPDYAGASITDAHIQSYNLSFDLSRTPIQKLGSKFAYARAVDFPVTVSLSVDAILSDLTTGALADIVDCDKEFDARITLKDPTCDVAPKPTVCTYILRGLKLDSESYTSSIGDNKSVTLDFTSQIGGPKQLDKGVFLSGYYAT